MLKRFIEEANVRIKNNPSLNVSDEMQLFIELLEIAKYEKEDLGKKVFKRKI